MRIGYAYLEEHQAVILIIAYSKGEKDDLTVQERKAIRSLLATIEEELSRRRKR
jgi:hypothetical protein